VRASVHFDQIFERSPNAYMLVDRQLRFVAANPAYLAVTGSSLEALLGRNLFEAFPDELGGPTLRESFERVLTTRAPDTLALIHYRVPKRAPDGTPIEGTDDRFWSASHIPLLDDAGNVEHILQHTVDVTEVHRLREAALDRERLEGASALQMEQGLLGRARVVQALNASLEEERVHLRRLFEQAPGFVCFLRGPDRIIELANAAYLALVGHRSIVGKPLREALPEVQGQGFFDLIDRVYETGEPFVGRGMRVVLAKTPGAPPEEAFLDFVYQPIIDPDGKVTGIFVSGQDITLQRRAEDERAALLERERLARARAEEAEKEHRFLAEAIPQQVWTARPDGQLDFVSQRVADYFGAPPEKIVGNGWQTVLHPDDLERSLAAWTHSLQTGDVYEIEFRLRRHDGSFRWHLGRALALRDAAGNIVRWYGTNTDVHEARRVRDQLQERTEFEKQLIGIVAHDLRNPLAGIGLSASLLLRRGNLDPQQGQIVGRIASMGDRATRLIRDFLDFSQARSVGRIRIEPKAANLRDLTRQAVDEVLLSHPEREAVVVHHGEAAGRWDADRLAQVVGNLVGNAFQHSPPGTPVRVTSRIDGAHAEIAVHNDGAPIPDADRGRLFAPFQRGEGTTTTASRSVGLGLYIARELVVAHGGTIDVDSREGEGTTFTVRLPREVRDSPTSAREGR
jgi:PAS domain S-box-containing protein